MTQGAPPPALLPELKTPVPGPRSRALARRLARVESRNITAVGPHGPIFWETASGALVTDVDGNRFLDLTAGFGVTATGHGNPRVAGVIGEQARRLVHAMGDVHPAAVKVELLERLAAIAPGDLDVAILSSNGSDAVESALKTAFLATGRAGLIAFEGSYHGLGYGALAVTGIDRFRRPFRAQLHGGVRFAPYPTGAAESADRSLESVRRLVREAESGGEPVGAVIVEPIQGRGGIRVPPPGFLSGLRQVCTELDVLLIVDEIYTGLGRTGSWFACDADGVVPDLLVVGKSLGGGLPLSAAMGSASLMEAWPASEGEALHTSTFLGNPVACSAALAQLAELEERGLVDAARSLGEWLGRRLDGLVAAGRASSARGRGLMRALGLEGVAEPGSAELLTRRLLRRGVLALPEGEALALTPPLVVTEAQLEWALDVLSEELAAVLAR